MRLAAISVLSVLLSAVSAAQTGTSYTFLNPPPPQVTSLTGTVVGEPGQETYYYWVVARYPGGNSAPYGPVTVRNARPVAQMSTLRYITLTWTAQDLATGYDVLRSTSSTTPTGACGCVIFENTSSTTVNDTGITASAYTVTNGSSVYGAIYIDSLNEAPPKLKQNVNGTISDVGAGGGGGASYCRSTTGNDTYTCTLTQTLEAYTRGECLVLDADTANTGAASVNVDSLGAKSILNRAGGALSNGDITADKPITVCYDGTNYIIQGDGGPVSSVTAGATGAITVSPTTGAAVVDIDTAYVPSKTGTNTWTGANDFTSSTVTGLTREYGIAVGDPAGSALSTGVLGYMVVPYACTIIGWDILVDSGTATVDVWKIATGTAIPTVSNTITASAKPAISSGTAVYSTTLTGWTTSVAAGDILGFNLDATSGPKFIMVGLRCR